MAAEPNPAPAGAARSPARETFTVRLTYFKPTGKYYTDTTFQWTGRTLPDGSCYMPDVVAHVRGLRDNAGQGALYGLSWRSEGWDGPILVDCDRGYPTLLMPRVE